LTDWSKVTDDRSKEDTPLPGGRVGNVLGHAADGGGGGGGDGLHAPMVGLVLVYVHITHRTYALDHTCSQTFTSLPWTYSKLGRRRWLEGWRLVHRWGACEGVPGGRKGEGGRTEKEGEGEGERPVGFLEGAVKEVNFGGGGGGGGDNRGR
jgi:hypothetical protein